MIVKLFDDQLILDIPNTKPWISFKRMPEIVEFCSQFNYERSNIVTNHTSSYIVLDKNDSSKWYSSSRLDYSQYDATNELLEFIKQSKVYEYW